MIAQVFLDRVNAAATEAGIHIAAVAVERRDGTPLSDVTIGGNNESLTQEMNRALAAGGFLKALDVRTVVGNGNG